MTIYVLKIDGEIRGLFTDESACYQVVEGYDKCGRYDDVDVTPIEANQVSEEPLL